MDQLTNVSVLKEKVKKFCEDRQWDQYHNAKELSIGLITEASELLEHFRFLTNEQTQDKMQDLVAREEIADELADVLFFILRFSQRYDFDLTQVFLNKLEKNDKKYPIDQFKGKNNKSSIEV